MTTNRRLTTRQTAATIGINLGSLVVLRSRGSRFYDPSFPPMVNQTFDEAAILEWKNASDRRPAQSSSPAQTPLVDSTGTLSDRRTTIDRRNLSRPT
jgi:hypothetical protein